MTASRKEHQAIHLYQQGLLAIQTGEIAEGASIMLDLSRLHPNWVEPSLVLVEISIQAGDLDSAEQSLANFIDRAHLDNRIQFLIGRLKEERGLLYEAKTIFESLAQSEPPFSSAISQLAKILILLERWVESERWIRRGLKLRPNGPDLLANLAVVLLRQNKPAQALEVSNSLVEQIANNDDILINHATILQELGFYEEAAQFYQEVLRRNPRELTAISNMGVLEFQKGNFSLAENYYRDALLSNRSDIRTAVNLSGLLLLTGHSNEGWDLYQRRLEQADRIMDVPNNMPAWGGARVANPVLLVHEQGLGDTFQFIRYAKGLKSLTPWCEFLGPEKLHPIILESGLAKKCHSDTPNNPQRFAGWIPLMSLPLLEQKKLIEVDHTSPYLHTPVTAISRWEKLLGTQKKFRVALHWQGNPNHEFTISRGRSLPLSDLAPVSKIENIQLISLQKGPGSEQWDFCSFKNYFSDVQPIINKTWSYTDTAAILQNCDLLISSDSGLAHLAGGLGKRVLLLLPQIPEWRWGLERNTTDWYPNHRLIRQEFKGDWSGPVREACLIMKSLIKNPSIF